jgi:hypothetical protein
MSTERQNGGITISASWVDRRPVPGEHEVREQPWLFPADSSDDARLSQAEIAVTFRAGGQCVHRPLEKHTVLGACVCSSMRSQEALRHRSMDSALDC